MPANGAPHRGAPGVPLPGIGRRMLRVEDRPLLTGTAEFVDDLRFPDVLHARFFRSPLAHATITGIDLEAARAAPGVAGVFAAAELGLPPLCPPVDNAGSLTPTRPLLAEGVVRFVGEAMAVVVADSPYAAEDAGALIEAGLEPRPALVDPEASAGAESIHGLSSNVLFEDVTEVGEVDAAFARAHAVVERTFRNPRYCATPIEPRGAVAAPDGDGVRIWSSTQVPHILADVTAQLLGLERGRVRVSTPDIGGGFGQKAHAYPEEIVVAWLARRLGRPVKWVEDRSENLLASSHARDQTVRVRAAVDADGRLLAIDADVLCDVGAYGVYPHAHMLEALGTPAMIPGPYRLGAYRARARAVATNKCPEGAYRGVGLPVAAFVHERLMDLLAAELGMDRAELRRRNLVPAAEMPYATVTNQRYDSGDYALALERALEAVGYDGFAAEQRAARADGRLLGLGLSSYVEYTGMGSRVFQARGMIGIPGHEHAWIRLDGAGDATVWTSLPSIGQGLATTFAQLAADAVGLEPETVRVARVDTGVGPGDGTGTFASRSAVCGGGALAVAGDELRRRLIDDAAERLEASSADLELAGGRVTVRGSPSRGVSVAELTADATDGRYDVDAAFDSPTTVYPYATHACVVEVDAGTGEVRVLRYVVAEDCGRVINPLIVEGQAHGAIAQGIGGTLHEALHYDQQGQLVTASLLDYLIPTAADLPAMAIQHLEIPAPDSPNGAKGVGEGGTLAPPGALANAVSDAVGTEFNELPLTPERVLHALGRGNTRTSS
ncbi:MAG: aerobic carbon-monoxide dehydrogenase large subunit [Solirubrobacteraceae bacterium]|nr:aerobic carbon-monoxide dehydrogenase large subunit [Solirubrobacteraceae bacterium]